MATEGALLGSVLARGLSRELVIVSDGAGQFAILLHALCWVHAERLIRKLISACLTMSLSSSAIHFDANLDTE